MVATAVEVTSKEEQLKTVASAPARRTIISIWYPRDQATLMQTLDQHVQVLHFRLQRPYTHDYFGYPDTIPTVDPNAYQSMRERQEKEVQEHQQRYHNAVENLARASLLVPCVTPHFLKLFYQDIERNPRLKELLAQPELQIEPVLLQPTNGIRTQFPTPLTAYEGYERDEACRRICAVLEKIMHKRYPESKPSSRRDIPTSLFVPEKKPLWSFR